MTVIKAAINLKLEKKSTILLNMKNHQTRSDIYIYISSVFFVISLIYLNCL